MVDAVDYHATCRWTSADFLLSLVFAEPFSDEVASASIRGWQRNLHGIENCKNGSALRALKGNSRGAFMGWLGLASLSTLYEPL